MGGWGIRGKKAIGILPLADGYGSGPMAASALRKPH